MQTAIVGAAAVVLVGLLTFFGVRRTAKSNESIERLKASGTIQTSEAETLWTQAEQIRKELRDGWEHERQERQAEAAELRREREVEAAALRTQHAKCQEQLSALTTKLEKQMLEMSDLKNKLRDV